MRLFNRTTRSVAVTLEGAAFLAKIEPLVFGLVEALAAPIRGDDHVRRVLRINTPLPAVLYLLPEIIPAFGRRPPLVEPELHHEERLTDVVAQGCDAGIRLSKIVSGDMIGVRFGKPLRWIAETSPAYMEQCGRTGHAIDLMAHRCIRVRMPDGCRYMWEFSRGDDELEVDVPGQLTLDRMVLTVEAAFAGLGIAYVLRDTIEARLAAGELVDLFPEWTAEEKGYMLYYPGRRSPPPQLTAFTRFLRSYDAQAARP
jgi:DNA-binding transcriptional LysR family regulator